MKNIYFCYQKISANNSFYLNNKINLKNVFNKSDKCIIKIIVVLLSLQVTK